MIVIELGSYQDYVMGIWFEHNFPVYHIYDTQLVWNDSYNLCSFHTNQEGCTKSFNIVMQVYMSLVKYSEAMKTFDQQRRDSKFNWVSDSAFVSAGEASARWFCARVFAWLYNYGSQHISQKQSFFGKNYNLFTFLHCKEFEKYISSFAY